MKTVKIWILGLSISLLSCQVVLAEDFQSLTTLRDKVADFIDQQLPQFGQSKVIKEIGSLDPRLHLAPCADDELQIYIPNNASLLDSSTIGLRCQGSKPWSLYLPVKFSVMTAVLTAKQPLVLGAVIRADDLQLQDFDSKRLSQGYFTDPKALIGVTLKHGINPGAVITPADITIPKLVNRGDTVQVQVLVEGIQVSTKALALSDGRLGDFIPVKNLNSSKVFDAKVISNQQVEVVVG